MKQQTLQIIYLALIAVCIFLFVFTIKTFIENKNLITADPINYGMRLHNFTDCTCLDSKGKIWKSTETGFTTTFRTTEQEPNLMLNYIKANNLTE